MLRRILNRKVVWLFLFMAAISIVVYFFMHNKCIKNIAENIEETYQIYEENRLLKKSLQQYEVMKAQIYMLKNDKENLEKLYNKSKELKEQATYKFMHATVINRMLDKWYDRVAIDKGVQNGVKRDMAVITTDGFIGKVESVEQYTSIVNLVSKDERTNRLAVTLLTDHSILGFVTGYDEQKKVLKIEKIPKDKAEKIKKGDKFVTSNLSTKIISGLEVAEVVDQESDEYGLTQIIYAKPKANLYDLEHVILLE
ncbi:MULTISPECIES: rod shape-determining protein MreC [Bacillus cereus group]|uniref:rod shape-determining protein MreC n=1 Tax=Bacillus cereus group TaxID=86661 RepID=UPI0005CA10A7|nr:MULTISPECIES: rod shape-determining protein MreC [Bacillus cereus group]KIZ27624.1 rod shape-determining protein MreC [Bacillus cereus]MBJ8127370.1 rod shape-determining protein MreC [Bacillus cereus]PFO23170.1 rod shape-determining protein MreC [Bacillus thuringiensis]